jgi:hypothetical protein
MKAFILALSLCAAPLLCAQKEQALPEPSAPPFEVGALPLHSGYTVEREDAPDLNFRFVDNLMRLYWLDDEGLIMEPEVSGVTIRFDQNMIRSRTRDYHRLKPLSGDTALGSPYILVPPHLYYVTLVISPPDSDEVESYHFRYMSDMDAVASSVAD